MSFNVRDYEGHPITFRDDGWFNATESAKRFSQEVHEWLRLATTERYIAALGKALGFEPGFPRDKLVRTSKVRGQAGTWLHPKLAIIFARWLSDDFAVWCDCQIDSVIRGGQDWSRARHISVASAKLLQTVIKECREADGKIAEDVHYMCEHKLVNSLLTGQFKGINRDNLSGWQLDFIGHFDMRDSFLMARGINYNERKKLLGEEAKAWRAANAHRIEAANEEQRRIA